MTWARAPTKGPAFLLQDPFQSAAEAPVAKIMYVGKKPMKTDNVAGTDTVWNGKGDVQEVSDPAAVEKMVAHADVWRVVPDKPGEKPKAEKAKPKAKSKVRDLDENQDLPPIVNFQSLGRDAIERYARQHLGYEVDQRHKLADIRANAQKAYNQIVARGGK